MKTRALSPCAALLLVALAACAVEDDPERNSKDSERTKAVEMPLDRVVIDNIDQDGDQTDWKYVIIPANGLAKVIINFDNENAEPQVEVINAVGQVLSNLDLPESSQFLRQLSFQVQPGTYYLNIYVDEGATDYSVEVQFSPGG